MFVSAFNAARQLTDHDVPSISGPTIPAVAMRLLVGFLWRHFRMLTQGGEE